MPRNFVPEYPRLVHFQPYGYNPTPITGEDILVDDVVQMLEAGGGYTLYEQAEAPTEIPPASADELEIMRIQRSDFGYNVPARRIHTLMEYTGIRTYADALAAGSSTLNEWGLALRRMELMSRVGSGAMIPLIKAIVWRETGHILPEQPATPTEQHCYYTDIRNASPVLGIAAGQLDVPIYLAAGASLKRKTIGALIDRPPTLDQIEQWTHFMEPHDRTSLVRFLGSLHDTVVTPFEAAR